MSFHNNAFNHLLDSDPNGDGSSSSLQDLSTSSSPTGNERCHLRRNSLGPFSGPGNSEDDVEGSHYSPIIDRENSLPLPRTRSLDRLDSVTAGDSPKMIMTGLPPPPQAVTAAPITRSDSPNILDNGPSSPLLRMLNQHTDVFPVEEDRNEPLQIMRARENFTAPRPTVTRTMSEVWTEAVSAPVTARDREPSTSLQHPQRPMIPITEHNIGGAGTCPQALQEVCATPPHPNNGGTATASIVTTVRRDTRPLPSARIPAAQSLGAYVAAELHPGPSYPTTDVIWGQSERDRVYNALLAVPYQLERLLWLGTAVCMDSFLAVFTLLPLRVVGALGTLVLCLLQSITPSRHGRHGVESSTHLHPEEDICAPPSSSSSPPSSKRRALRGDQIYDVLCALMFSFVVTFLWRLKAGSIYYWVKDLTQEFLKLSVLQTALELSDKICCSFLVDVLEALAASCTAFAAQPHWSTSHAFNVMSDAAVALALLTAHGATLMAQALVFGVAMNSQKNTLLALLIASNFTEIKGTVMKRFDPTKIFVLASQDVVERFHLIIVLAFVLVEEMSGTGAALPSARLMSHMGYILLAEVVIDVTKHAVLGKFNEIRPGVYREFTKDLCEQLATAQSHTAHRLVGFEPFAPAALFFRVILSYVSLRREDPGAMSAARGIMAIVLAWAALVIFKLGLGYLVKRGAVGYLGRYEARRARGRAGSVRGRSVAFVGTSPAPVVGTGIGASASPTKKDA